MSSDEFYDLSTIELKETIGSGGFGKVYQAIDRKTKNILAVKISLKPVTESSDDMISLMREVNIMSQFSHPSILKLFGYNPKDFDKEPYPVIISEYAPNGSLKRMIDLERNDSTLTGWDDTQKLICIYGIASAMEYLHSFNAIHRDLKPDNILLNEYLYPKIADFGLAKILHKEFDSMTPQSNAGLKGTVCYLAPECIEDEEYSKSSDVYAFAYIVYELITTTKPFEHLKYMQILNKVIEGTRPHFNSKISPPYKKLIEDCWNQNSLKRPTFSKIIQLLEEDDRFITKTVKGEKFHAYVEYIKHCKKSFDSKRTIIDPARFMTRKKIKIKKVDVDAELSKFEEEDRKDDLMDESPKTSTTRRARVSMYPKSDYNRLAKSCQELVLEAEKSAEKQFKVAKNLIEGKEEFPKDVNLGVTYLKKSLSQGYIDPEAYGIRILIEGKLIPRDLDSAKQVLSKSMEKSDTKYQILYGKIMKKENKFESAKKLFEKAASIGNGEAKYELGKMYFKGRGVDSDEGKAKRLFKESKKDGCAKSDNFLLRHHSSDESKSITKRNSSKLESRRVLRTFKPVKKEIEDDDDTGKSFTTSSLMKSTSKGQTIADKKRRVQRIGDIDESAFKSLSALFAKSPDKAIKESEEFILDPDYDSYESFLDYVKKSQKSNCCIVSWSNHMLSARCLDCQKEDNSCICIPCFLAGKHDQHHSYIIGSSGAGNCDCGDPNFWKKSGNCPNHPGPDEDPDLTQMTPAIRKRFITVMKAAFNGGFMSKNDDVCSQNFNWVKKFIQFGDGFRRCCSIAITSFDTKFLLESIQQLDDNSITVLIDLLGQLISDRFFSVKMGGYVIENYLSMRKKIQSFLYLPAYDKKRKPFHPIKKFLAFSFHFFNQRPLYGLIEKSDFNWVDFIIDSIEFVLETCKKVNGDYHRMDDGEIHQELWYLLKLIEPLIKDESQHDNIQTFINKYSRLLLQYEAIFKFSILNDHNKEPNANETGLTYLFIMIHIYDINIALCSKLKETVEENKVFDISETFSCLVDFLKSERELEAESIYTDEKRVPIAPFIPLHHLFFCLLVSQKNPASLIKRECKKKKITLQEFCSLCSIYPLRFLCSMFDPRRFADNDRDVLQLICVAIDRPDELFNPFFGLIQYLLGITPNKDKILMNILKTFDAFSRNNDDDGMSELGILLGLLNLLSRKRGGTQFMATIFIVSILTDRSIVSFDKVLFKRLRVIELLSRSKPSAREIENHVNDKISNPTFGDDLISYAERVRTSNGSYFRLTNESEFTPFFPLILNDKRVNLLSKSSEKLIKFSENLDLPNDLSFDGCFRSPIFISLMFSCLQNEKKLAEQQVGFVMFILAMQNGPKYDSSSFKKSKRSLMVHGEDLKELIENLSEVYDSESINFSMINIQLGSSESKTILEIVESNHQLGHEVIFKADLPIKIKLSEKDDSEIQKQKKAKAKKLKENIIKEYETRRNLFNLGGTSAIFGKKISEFDDKENEFEEDKNKDEDEDDLFKTVSLRTSMTNSFIKAKLQCSICQNVESADVIGFPCLSYPSIFPSIIQNKLHKLKKPLTDMETVFSLSICTHAVHCNCCNGLYKGGTFKCTIDRGERNCLLPYFHSRKGKNIFEMKLTQKMKESVELFMNKAFKIDDDEENKLVAIKSFVGLIVVIEVRHRNRPECLDNANVPFLLRNLLLTLYFYFQREKPDKPSKIKDPLVSLMFKVFESKTPKTEFVNFVGETVKTVKSGYIYEFLRRAAIIEDFALNEQLFDGKFIDWDDIFSFNSLTERYKIDSFSEDESVELPPFETIQLAERFVSLYQKPYNLDIFDTTFSKCVDLLTGKVVVYAKNEKNKGKKCQFMFIHDYVNKYYKGGLAMFLGITGPNASDLIYSCQAVDKMLDQDGFYIDQFGDIDHGFRRGAILSLSQDRLDSALDKLLSGDVLLY